MVAVLAALAAAGGLLVAVTATAYGDGSAPASAEPASRIVNGEPTTIERHPWQVQITSEDGSAHRCGGVLVHPRVVLTAAHCLPRPSLLGGGDRVGVYAGRTSRTSGGERLEVSGVHIAPEYRSTSHRNDYGFLTLAAPSRLGVPIQIAGPDERRLWESGRDAVVSGYGYESEDAGRSSDVLRHTTVPILADQTCVDLATYRGVLDPSVMLCAGYLDGRTDACFGDSGGPLAVPADERSASGVGWRLVGLVSFGDGCAQPDAPGVYTRVAEPAMTARIVDLLRREVEPALSVAAGSIALVGSGAVPRGCLAAEAVERRGVDRVTRRRSARRTARKRLARSARRVRVLQRQRASRRLVVRIKRKRTAHRKALRRAKQAVRVAKRDLRTASGARTKACG